MLFEVAIALPAGAMAAEPLDNKPYVVVCSDGGAGGYEAFPDLIRMKDGRLMCPFYAGYNHVSEANADHPKGGRIMYALSEDEGQTWGTRRGLYDSPGDDRDPSQTRLAHGQLLLRTFFPACGGAWLLTSDDRAKTWSESRRLATDEYWVGSPVRELKSGRLILGLDDGSFRVGPRL